MVSVMLWNELDTLYTIQAGQKLKIKIKEQAQKPSTSQKSERVQTTERVQTVSQDTYHIVKAGENVFRISLRYKVSMDAIKSLNNLDSNCTIEIGQKLLISKSQKKATNPVVQKPVVQKPVAQVQQPKRATEEKANKVAPKEVSSLEVKKADNKQLAAAERQPASPKKGSILESLKTQFQKNRQYIVMGLGALLVLIIIYLLVRLILKRGPDYNYKKELYTDYISDWLYSADSQFIPPWLFKDMKNKNLRELFTKELIGLKANLLGATGNRLVELYEKLGLQDYIIKKLNSRDINFKLEAINEVSQMEVKSLSPHLFKYVNHSNQELRKLAQFSWLKLNPEKYEELFQVNNILMEEPTKDDFKYIFADAATTPEYKNWVDYPNKSVSQFAIKMIGYLKQYDALDVLHDQLEESDMFMKKSIIEALQILNDESSAEILQNLYFRENKEMKAYILKVLPGFGVESNEQYFKDLMVKEKDAKLRVKANEALNEHYAR